VLKAMRRPVNGEKTLERIARWRDICPDLAIRSTFIVGFPGETEEDFELLLAWLREARIDRAGCFRYEPVAGARANDLGAPVPEEVKEERWHRFMAAQGEISAGIMAGRVGRETEVLIDTIDHEADEAVGRAVWDAPEIDGNVFLPGETGLQPGDMVTARVVEAEDYDLVGEVTRR
jgi:ribosomal protein S12 methylthiotransferase